ncbi:hypothetical protein LUZ60_006469 [Juncus effusus]|nr:hypothetical protein LUZ60_006469 [Juncus effusus]
MAMAAPSVALSPQVIANAFVEQYYRILHSSPDQVYRFYQDSSILSRSDPNGSLVSVTTLQGINEKIQSMDVRNYYWEIETADAQLSYMNGVFIVVTGCLSGHDRIQRRFTQTFFLAPQETNGYFVLNDILRVFLDRQVVQPVTVPVPVQVQVQVPVSEPAKETVMIASPPEPVNENGHMTEPAKANNNISKDIKLENGGSDLKDETGQTSQAVVNKEVVEREKPKQQPAVTQAKPKQASQSKPKHQAKQSVQVKEEGNQKDGSKKSYASIVIKGSPVPKPVQAPVSKPKPITEKTENQDPKPAESQESEITNNATVGTNTNTAVVSNTVVSENSSTTEVQGYSIYVRNLPQNATVEQLEELYKKYGAIKPNGVQVKMHRFDRYFFGFVEFETLEAMQAAIEDSPVKLDGRHVSCEEKKGLTRVTNSGPPRGENGIIGNGPRGPPFRDNNREYYSNDGFRGGRVGPPVRGGRGGPRHYSAPNRPIRGRDGHYHNTNNNSQRFYRDNNGSGGTRYEARSTQQSTTNDSA